jgi:LPS-assembly lipoprotein
LSGAGKVREYQLGHSITFKLVNVSGEEIIRPTKISSTREYNFDDSQVLAKEQEEALLYRDMQSDLVQQLMRRLAAVKS